MGAITALRPDLDQNVDALPLFVTGVLPSARPVLAYEGRLSIRNPSGPCTVEQVGGDALPPGSSLSVDNDTEQVVLAWPAYSEYVTPLENPGFETGDTSGWSFTPLGGGGAPVVDSAYRYEGAHSLRWPGGRGMGSEGGIEVEAWNNTIAPCLPGRRVTIHTRCMYNPAGHHFGSRYQGLIRFLDSMGNPIGEPTRGRQFKGRGNNGRWNDASATAVGPAGTVGVQMGAWLTGSEAPTWLDAASWDVPSSLGVNTVGVVNLTLRVRDSAGRTALWSGAVAISNFSPADLLPKFWMDDASDLEFDVGGTQVNRWVDHTSNQWDARYFGTGTGTVTAAPGELNGLRVCRFTPSRCLRMQSGAPSFASDVGAAWLFAVVKTRVLNTGRYVILFENGLVANTNARIAIGLGNTPGTVNSVRAMARRLDSDALEDLPSASPAPVGQWFMCLVAANYLQRELSLYVNGALSANKTGAWSGAGPSSPTNSNSVYVGASIVNTGSSAGGIANALDGDIACLIGGSGNLLPTQENIADLFAWASDRYGIPLG